MDMKDKGMKSRNLGWLGILFVFVLSFLFQGCETTDSGMTEVTGQLRTPVDESYVDIYQDPPGLVSWIPDMDIPTTYEQIAKMELSENSSSSRTTAIEDAVYNLVYSLKKRAARMGANAIVVRDVKVTEEVVEEKSSPYRTVRYPDGSLGQVEVPVTVSYRRVYKVTVSADSVFLDWDNV